MLDKCVLDTGYVIYCPEEHDYITSKVGIFKTKRNAEKRITNWIKTIYKGCEVRKVELRLVDEE